MPIKLKTGNAGGNLGDLAPQITNLTLVSGNAQIDVTFTGAQSEYLSLVRYYRIVAKANGTPTSPTDGTGVDIPVSSTGGSVMSTTISGLQNGVSHTVRVYIRCTNGWQSSVGNIGGATPLAGMQIQTLPVGSFVKLNENGVGVNYRIVNQGRPSSMYDASCDGAWLLREDIAENRQWHSSNVNDYANSTIKAYLNSTFLNRFSANIKATIKQVKIPYRPGSGTSAGVSSGASGLSCKVFLLSGYEMGWTSADHTYFPPDGARLAYFEAGNNISANNKRIAYLNGGAAIWWLRSPITNSSANAWRVVSNGNYGSNNCSVSYGVRPALVLPSDFLLNPTPNPDGSYNPLVG